MKLLSDVNGEYTNDSSSWDFGDGEFTKLDLLTDGNCGNYRVRQESPSGASNLFKSPNPKECQDFYHNEVKRFTKMFGKKPN